MKRFLLISLAAAGFLLDSSRPAKAYWGFDLGLQDNAHFGWGLNIGLNTPSHVGFDFQVVSNFQDKALYDQYFIQENFAIFYDFNHLFAEKNEQLRPLHPYAKLGFSYGEAILTALSVGGTDVGARLSHGPGMLFGIGADWKVSDPLAIGLDLFETILWLDGTSVRGVEVIDERTVFGFNLLLTFKFYDIL